MRRFVFPVPPPRAIPDHPAVTVERYGANAVPALRVPAAAGRATALYFHGNGAQLADLTPLAGQFADVGLGLVAVEYPGYGQAPGRPSETGLYENAQVALAELSGRRDDVILVGQSLGTAVATELAARGQNAPLVLISPFTSVRAVVRHHAGPIPLGLLVRERFDTLAKAPGIAQPVLIVHGAQDEQVPPAMGAELAAAFPAAVLVVVAGRGHNDLEDLIVPAVQAVAEREPSDWAAAVSAAAQEGG